MNSLLLNYINDFPIPEKFSESNCIICLQEFDLESGKKFISLPCKCSNSVYHIDCLVKWIQSGRNKNYCVHCKRTFEIPNLTKISKHSEQNDRLNELRDQELEHIIRIIDIPQREVNSQQQNNSDNNILVERENQIILRIQVEQIIEPVQISENNTDLNTATNSLQNMSLTEIMDRIQNQKNIIRFEFAYGKIFFHIVFNTIINLINFGYTCEINSNTELMMIGLLSLIKILFNFISISKIIINVESIIFRLFLSYIAQFTLIMITMLIIKNIYHHGLLLFTQIGFIVIDLIVLSVITYYCSVKLENVVYDMGLIQAQNPNP